MSVKIYRTIIGIILAVGISIGYHSSSEEREVKKVEYRKLIETGYPIEVVEFSKEHPLPYAENVGLWFSHIGHVIGLGTGCDLYNMVDKYKAIQIRLCEHKRTEVVMLDVLNYEKSKRMWLTKVEDRLIIEPQKESEND